MAFSFLPGFEFRKGVLSYLDAGGEQTIVELESTKIKVVRGVFIDLSSMANNGEIKIYYKIDGSNYRLFYTKSFTVATDPEGVFIDLNMAILDYLKITYTEGSDEGQVRSIPYTLSFERRY